MRSKTGLIKRIFLLLLPCLLFWYCQNGLENPESEGYRNLAAGVKYVGMETCQSCHSEIHESFAHTGMGQSFAPATRSKSAANYEGHQAVYDPHTNFYYYPYFQDSTLFIKEFRLQNGDTTYQRIEAVDYIVGSGQHTNSHIVCENGYTYQAPLTYYTQEQRWDLAPGFDEPGGNLRFSRSLNAECLTCHNHFPEQALGSLNKYTALPSGIECERCHGPGEIHVREKLQGLLVDTSKAIDYSIVNPRKLPRDLQMDLCQRCHLQGVAVLEEGKTFYDFKPGMRLQEVMQVFLPRFTNSHERFIMASQADRLRLSPCYQQSEMTCITCHNPHQSVEVTGVEQYNQACRSCHQTKTCSAPMADLEEQNHDCSYCHMPPSNSTDIPHVTITDHNIHAGNIRGQEQAASQDNARFLGLEILTKQEGSALEMAQGYLALYDKYLPDPTMLDSAGYYLGQAEGPQASLRKTRIHWLFNRGDWDALELYAQGFAPDLPLDPWSAYRIGEAYFQTRDFAVAKRYFQKAVDGLPLHLEFQEKLATTQLQLGELKPAEDRFLWILGENPKRPVTLCNLGFLKVRQRRFEEGEQYYDQALALDPDYIQALINKAAVRFQRNDRQTGVALLKRVLEIDPEHPEAKPIYEQFK